MINFPTIVSAFYDIRSKDIHNPNVSRKKNTYLELANQFILKLPYPLIIFTDDNQVKEFIENSRINFKDITYIYFLPFENTFFFKYINKLEELRNSFNIINGNKNHETPLYITLNNNKFDFIDKSIDLNPFQSSHFIWIDFGINHVAKNTEKIHEWIINIPDKIKQLCINPFLENGNHKDIFQYIYHHTAGGLFSGSSSNLKKYSELFKNKIEQIYSENWYQIDEAIMTIIQRENSDLFDLFYGDYHGIISNFNEPINNIDLIQVMIKKAYDYNNMNLLYKICLYILPYFKKNENQNNHIFYDFLARNIICNYYCNNKLLLIDIIILINKKILENDIQIKTLINMNKNNLNFYLNKNLIINL